VDGANGLQIVTLRIHMPLRVGVFLVFAVWISLANSITMKLDWRTGPGGLREYEFNRSPA